MNLFFNRKNKVSLLIDNHENQDNHSSGLGNLSGQISLILVGRAESAIAK